jgi:hypothetical protein
MPPRYSRYRGARWLFVHLMGTLVVLALALLSGAVIGGVGIYILNDALGPPPDGGAAANRAAVLADSADLKAKHAVRKPTVATTAEGGPVRTAQPVSAPPPVGPDKAPPPSQTSAPTSSAAEAQSSASAQPQASPAPQTAAAEQSQQNAAGRAEEKTSDNANSEASPRVPNSEVTRKAALAKRHAAVASARPSRSEIWGERQLSMRPVYDYYGRDDYAGRDFAPDSADGAMAMRPSQPVLPRAQRGLSQTRARIDVRQQDNFYQRPHRSFFGVFSQGRYSDRYNDDSHW